MADKAGGAKTPLRRIVLVQAKLDYGALEPGEAAADAIRQTAQDLHFDPAHGVRVRLTGEVPLADESSPRSPTRPGWWAAPCWPPSC